MNVQEVIQISKQAGNIIMDIYGKDDFQIESKADESPLTIADKASNVYIEEALTKLHPEYPIVSEETKQASFDERRQYDYCWMVDPLDGTKEFIKRNGEFAINIALIKNHQVILGVIHVPAKNETYFAELGQGAYQQLGDEDPTPITAASYNTSMQGIRIACSRSHINDATRAYMDKYNEPILKPLGSALKFTEIAKGTVHLYPRFGPTMEWDTAPAQILVEEAGGQIWQWGTQEPLLYNKENLLNPHFIAFGNGSYK